MRAAAPGLTGDDARAAQFVDEAVGIASSDVIARLLPAGKADAVRARGSWLARAAAGAPETPSARPGQREHHLG
jgi:hypothetical protein